MAAAGYISPIIDLPLDEFGEQYHERFGDRYSGGGASDRNSIAELFSRNARFINGKIIGLVKTKSGYEFQPFRLVSPSFWYDSSIRYLEDRRDLNVDSISFTTGPLNVVRDNTLFISVTKSECSLVPVGDVEESKFFTLLRYLAGDDAGRLITLIATSLQTSDAPPAHVALFKGDTEAAAVFLSLLRRHIYGRSTTWYYKSYRDMQDYTMPFIRVQTIMCCGLDQKKDLQGFLETATDDELRVSVPRRATVEVLNQHLFFATTNNRQLNTANMSYLAVFDTGDKRLEMQKEWAEQLEQESEQLKDQIYSYFMAVQLD